MTGAPGHTPPVSLHFAMRAWSPRGPSTTATHEISPAGHTTVGHRLGTPSCPSLRSLSTPQGKPGSLSGLAGVRTGCSHRLCSPGRASWKLRPGAAALPLPQAAQCPASASESSWPLCLPSALCLLSPARPGLTQIQGGLIKTVHFLPGENQTGRASLCLHFPGLPVGGWVSAPDPHPSGRTRPSRW